MDFLLLLLRLRHSLLLFSILFHAREYTILATFDLEAFAELLVPGELYVSCLTLSRALVVPASPVGLSQKAGCLLGTQSLLLAVEEVTGVHGKAAVRE